MEQFLTYQREFSALPGLQEGKTVCYVLTCDQVLGHICYGVRVTDIDLHRVISDGVHPFTDDRERAERILQYLYENSVRASQCVSVISDLCSALEWTGWEDSCGTEPDPIAHCG